MDRKLLINAPNLHLLFGITASLTLAGMGFTLINFGHVFYGWLQRVHPWAFSFYITGNGELCAQNQLISGNQVF